MWPSAWGEVAEEAVEAVAEVLRPLVAGAGEAGSLPLQGWWGGCGRGGSLGYSCNTDIKPRKKTRLKAEHFCCILLLNMNKRINYILAFPRKLLK